MLSQVPIRPWLAGLARVLYPPACPACHGDTGIEHSLCPSCWRDTIFLSRPACAQCGRPVPAGRPGEVLGCDDCLRHPRQWDRGAAALAYSGAGRKLVLALKHGDRLDLVPMLGRWMATAGRELLARADLIAPVPLHWTRRLQRRANQCAELSRWLSRTSGVRHAPGALCRVRRTPPQGGKDRAARIENLADALQVSDSNTISGKRVLLVDDVLTTGATLDAAAGVLRKAGATGVDILVIALAMGGSDGYFPELTEEDEHETG